MWLLLLALLTAPTGPTIRGDLNGDGEITAIDALAVLSTVVSKPLPDGWESDPFGDVNCDGQITALDALLVLSHTVGKDVSDFCIGQAVVTSVEVSPSSTALMSGQTQQLTATARDASGEVLTNLTVTWSSSGDGVATVDANGLVTGVSKGLAFITASTAGGSGTAVITVYEPSNYDCSLQSEIPQAECQALVITPPISLDSRLHRARGPEKRGRDDSEERGEEGDRRS